MQDGEKKYLLCNKCEEFFSVFETQFTNFFLDDFLKNKKLIKKQTKKLWFKNYMLSVVWRIIYDDLYNAGSFAGDTCRTIFVDNEKKIRDYFNALMNNGVYELPRCWHCVYKIDDIVQDKNIIKLLEPTLFGYCYFDGEYQIPLVISYYLGLVFVTVFDSGSVVYVDSITKTIKRKYCLSGIVKKIVSEEIKTEAISMAAMYRDNMTPELFERIKKYYDRK